MRLMWREDSLWTQKDYYPSCFILFFAWEFCSWDVESRLTHRISQEENQQTGFFTLENWVFPSVKFSSLLLMVAYDGGYKELFDYKWLSISRDFRKERTACPTLSGVLMDRSFFLVTHTAMTGAVYKQDVCFLLAYIWFVTHPPSSWCLPVLSGSLSQLSASGSHRNAPPYSTSLGRSSPREIQTHFRNWSSMLWTTVF